MYSSHLLSLYFMLKIYFFSFGVKYFQESQREGGKWVKSCRMTMFGATVTNIIHGLELYMAPCIDCPLITHIFTFIVSYVICCRCMACVSSMWPCHWCVKDEVCTHDKSCPRQHIIYNSRVSVHPLISPRALPSPDR